MSFSVYGLAHQTNPLQVQQEKLQNNQQPGQENMENASAEVAAKSSASVTLPKRTDGFSEQAFGKKEEKNAQVGAREDATSEKQSNLEELIREKVESGSRLTSVEMDYLRDNQPGLYDKAVKMEELRNKHIKILTNATTREQAAELHQQERKEAVDAVKNDASTEKMVANTLDQAYKDQQIDKFKEKIELKAFV